MLGNKKSKVGLGTVKSAIAKGKSAKDKFDSTVSVSEADYAEFMVADLMYSLLTGPTESIGNLLHGLVKETDKARVVKVSGVITAIVVVLSLVIALLSLKGSGLFLPLGGLMAWYFIFVRCASMRAKAVDELVEIEQEEFDDYEVL